MKNLLNSTHRTFSVLLGMFLMLAFALPTDVMGQEGFIRIKNNTGRPANDLHIAFIGQAPALVTRTVNGVQQPHGNVFRNGRTRGGRQVVWDFDNATQNVPPGSSVSILINYARNRANVPQTPRIDWRNSYWTFNGQRIPVRRRPNALAPRDVEILGIALDPRTNQPQLPVSPDDHKNDQGGGNQGGADQGGNDGAGQGQGGNQDGPPAQGIPPKCECLGVSFKVILKVMNGERVVRQKTIDVNIPQNQLQDARRGGGQMWRKQINISKATLPVANNEVVEMEVTNVHIRCRCNPPDSGECQAYPYTRATRPGIKLGINTVSTQPKNKTIPAGGGDKVRFQSIHNIPPYADISVSGACKGCGGEQGAARVRGELRINLNRNVDSGFQQGGQGGNQGTGGNNQGGNNQGGNNQGDNNQGGNDQGSSGGAPGGNSGGNSGGNNSGGNNSGGSSGGNSGHQGGDNQGGTSGSGGHNNQNAEGEKIQNLLENYQRWGNFQGICGTGLQNLSQMFPEEYQKILEREEQIKQWLQSKGVPLPPGCNAGNQNQLPPAHQDLRDQIGDEAYRNHLRRNKAQHGNYQGLCGTSIMELQRNFPKLYQEYLERERALEEFMRGN